MAFEHFVGVDDKLRRFAWFNDYMRWLENRLALHTVWNGAGGIVITLAGPLLLVVLITWALSEWFTPIALLFSLTVLIFSLGPRYLNPQLDELIDAMEQGDWERIKELMLAFSDNDNTFQNDQELLENILVEANERLFGVLFWFIVLGPFGALLYRLACILRKQQSDIHGHYAESAQDLYNILNWPPARLLTLGNAVTGNMVDAMEAWREVEKQSLTVNEDVICAGGLGALSFQQQESAADDESVLQDKIYWLHALQGLLNRTLLAWLTVLGIMTLYGWLI
jgi:membrane protein required for beta-lactamase induction